MDNRRLGRLVRQLPEQHRLSEAQRAAPRAAILVRIVHGLGVDLKRLQ